MIKNARNSEIIPGFTLFTVHILIYARAENG